MDLEQFVSLIFIFSLCFGLSKIPLSMVLRRAKTEGLQAHRPKRSIYRRTIFTRSTQK